MIVLNERTQVKRAIKQWVDKYCPSGTDGGDDNWRNVGEALMALDQETATSADVAHIIGDSYWACKKACHECGKETWDIVELGEPPDHDSATACVCRNCLRAALFLLDDA